MRIAIMAGLVPLAFLAGCQNDAQRLATARTEALAKCNNDANIKAGLAGLDTGRFCTCLTNKIFEGRTVADLAKMDSDAEAQRVGMEGSAQCIAEQAGAAAPGTPVVAVPPQVQDGASETAEEAGDEAN